LARLRLHAVLIEVIIAVSTGTVHDNTDYTILLEQLKTFDINAFEALYVHTRERLFVYAFSILKDEDAAQDIVQELFVDLWENRLFLNIHTGLIGYLVRSVRNRSLDQLKKQQNHRRLAKDHFYAAEKEVAIRNILENKELGAVLEAVIHKLPPMPAKVFRLHYIEKLNYTEIAEKLQISSNTVSNHMTRALKDLRENLKNIDAS
jgi:RNA polymerase sigma-70 factor (ECF subfamily)